MSSNASVVRARGLTLPVAPVPGLEYQLPMRSAANGCQRQQIEVMCLGNPNYEHVRGGTRIDFTLPSIPNVFIDLTTMKVCWELQFDNPLVYVDPRVGGVSGPIGELLLTNNSNLLEQIRDYNTLCALLNILYGDNSMGNSSVALTGVGNSSYAGIFGGQPMRVYVPGSSTMPDIFATNGYQAPLHANENTTAQPRWVMNQKWNMGAMNILDQMDKDSQENPAWPYWSANEAPLLDPFERLSMQQHCEYGQLTQNIHIYRQLSLLTTAQLAAIPGKKVKYMHSLVGSGVLSVDNLIPSDLLSSFNISLTLDPAEKFAKVYVPSPVIGREGTGKPDNAVDGHSPTYGILYYARENGTIQEDMVFNGVAPGYNGSGAPHVQCTYSLYNVKLFVDVVVIPSELISGLMKSLANGAEITLRIPTFSNSLHSLIMPPCTLSSTAPNGRSHSSPNVVQDNLALTDIASSVRAVIMVWTNPAYKMGIESRYYFFEPGACTQTGLVSRSAYNPWISSQSRYGVSDGYQKMGGLRLAWITNGTRHIPDQPIRHKKDMLAYTNMAITTSSAAGILNINCFNSRLSVLTQPYERGPNPYPWVGEGNATAANADLYYQYDIPQNVKPFNYPSAPSAQGSAVPPNTARNNWQDGWRGRIYGNYVTPNMGFAHQTIGSAACYEDIYGEYSSDWHPAIRGRHYGGKYIEAFNMQKVVNAPDVIGGSRVERSLLIQHEFDNQFVEPISIAGIQAAATPSFQAQTMWTAKQCSLTTQVFLFQDGLMQLGGLGTARLLR